MIRPFFLQVMAIGLIWFSGLTEARTFKIATVAQEGTEWMKIMRDAAKKIKDATDGRVKFKYYGGGVMGSDSQVIRKIRIGQLQGAAVTTGALTRFSNDLELYNLPMVFRSYDEVDHIRAQFDERLRLGLEKAGFVSFGFAEGGFAYAMTKNRVSSVADARQQKVWTPTDDLSALRAMEAFGISPIPLGLADVLLALQADTLNTVAGPAIAALALQWHTQVKYLVTLPLIYTYALMAMDKKQFAAISDADQKIVRKLMAEGFRAIDVYNRQDHESAFKALENQGIEFVRPTSVETSEWRRLAQKAVAQAVARDLIDSALYEDFRKAVDLYRQQQN